MSDDAAGAGAARWGAIQHQEPSVKKLTEPPEADDLLAVIREQVEKERIEKQKANAANQHKEPLGNKLPKPEAGGDAGENASPIWQKIAR